MNTSSRLNDWLVFCASRSEANCTRYVQLGSNMWPKKFIRTRRSSKPYSFCWPLSRCWDVMALVGW